MATYAYDSAGNLWSITIATGQGMLEKPAPASEALAAAAQVGAANLNPAAAIIGSILNGQTVRVARVVIAQRRRSESRDAPLAESGRARSAERMRLAASTTYREGGR